MKTVHALYFSATQTTSTIVKAIAESISNTLSLPMVTEDITTPSQRAAAGLLGEQQPDTCAVKPLSFNENDIVIFGVPVYIGRVPNLIKPFLCRIVGGGAVGIPVVVYGNRNYDDALLELRDLMKAGGFDCGVAAAAFSAEHCFSKVLGAGRPDAQDLAVAKAFGERICETIAGGKRKELEIPGNVPYRFFSAVDDNGKPFDIRKAKPATDSSKCTGCGECVRMCPMGSIDANNPALVNGICIKCNACVKRCPAGAKRFEDERYLEHLGILERNYANIRKEPELFF